MSEIGFLNDETTLNSSSAVMIKNEAHRLMYVFYVLNTDLNSKLQKIERIEEQSKLCKEKYPQTTLKCGTL